VFFCALALAVLLPRCEEGGRPPSSDIEDNRPRPQRSDGSRLIETKLAVCRVGERPNYFVPGPVESPLALVGCARLGVSGKHVEFSANLAALEGELETCINPAYSGRRRRGLYIPAICKLDPPLSRFAVRDAAQPRQGVRGYAYVVWGTAGASTEVVARFADGTAQAAVMRVGRALARKFGESPFRLFVVELPVSGVCAAVTVAGTDRTPRNGSRLGPSCATAPEPPSRGMRGPTALLAQR